MFTFGLLTLGAVVSVFASAYFATHAAFDVGASNGLHDLATNPSATDLKTAAFDIMPRSVQALADAKTGLYYSVGSLTLGTIFTALAIRNYNRA